MFVLACGEQSSLLFDFNNTFRYILKITFLRLLILSPSLFFLQALTYIPCFLSNAGFLKMSCCMCMCVSVGEGECVMERPLQKITTIKVSSCGDQSQLIHL